MIYSTIMMYVVTPSILLTICSLQMGKYIYIYANHWGMMFNVCGIIPTLLTIYHVDFPKNSVIINSPEMLSNIITIISTQWYQYYVDHDNVLGLEGMIPLISLPFQHHIPSLSNKILVNIFSFYHKLKDHDARKYHSWYIIP